MSNPGQMTTAAPHLVSLSVCPRRYGVSDCLRIRTYDLRLASSRLEIRS